MDGVSILMLGVMLVADEHWQAPVFQDLPEDFNPEPDAPDAGNVFVQ